MRIALSGVQCTGKSTLLKEMEKLPEFKDYEIIYEVVRKMLNEIKINEDGDNNTQEKILDAHLYNLKPENVITDRCIVDCLAYGYYSHNHGKISDADFSKFEKRALEHVNDYDVIFYIRPEFKMVEDGVRSLNIEFRDEVQGYFEEIIKKLKNVIILTGTVEERMGTIMKIFEEKNERA